MTGRRQFLVALAGALPLVAAWDLASGPDRTVVVWREEDLGPDGVLRGRTRMATFYDGQTETVAVWNRLLTDDEMRALALAGR